MTAPDTSKIDEPTWEGQIIPFTPLTPLIPLLPRQDEPENPESNDPDIGDEPEGN